MRRLTAVLAAMAVGVGLTGGWAGPAAAAEPRPVNLTEGHIDLFDVTYDGSGLDLQVKDDSGLYGQGSQVHRPEDVTITVDGALAAQTVPDLPDYAFLGEPGATFYQLPFTQDPALPWPGWSTERVSGVTLAPGAGAVELDVQVDGPGELHTYMFGAFGNPINRYVTGSSGTIPIARNSHVHTEWAFSEPGDYYLTVTPSGTTEGGAELTGEAAEYHFQVLPEAADTELGLELTPNRAGAEYLYGQGIRVKAAPTTQTDFDHYHWFVKRAGAADFTVVSGALTDELRLTTSLVWDGAEVVAKLYDDDHQVVAESEPLTLSVTALEPVTDLVAQADKASYAVGETAQFTSTQTPDTGIAHYHWYVKKPGEEFYTWINGTNDADASLLIDETHDGASVQIRLFNDDHAVIAESDPIVLQVGEVVDEPTVTETAVTLSKATQRFAAPGPSTIRVAVTAASGDDVPAGTVTVTAGDRVIGQAPVGADGRATVAAPGRLPVGKHAVNATFAPADADAFAASSGSAARQLTVTKARSSVRASLVRNRIAAGQRGVVRVRLQVANLPNTGRVAVLVNGKRVKAVRVMPRHQGVRTVRLPRAPRGTHQVRVRFLGGPNVAAAAANGGRLTVR